jgi:hypothetical protein
VVGGKGVGTNEQATTEEIAMKQMNRKRTRQEEEREKKKTSK